MFFKLLDKIDKRTKYSVDGWIRNKEKQLRISNVPSMVKALIILFYRKDDIFHLINNNEIKLSDNKKIITKIKENSNYSNFNFGIIEIPSDLDIICIWHLRINKQVSLRAVVGIGSSTNGILCWPDNDYSFWNGKITSQGGDWVSYGKCLKERDQVSIHLNLKRSEIKLVINGDDQGIAFTNVKRSEHIKYRLWTSLYSKNDSVEIIGFTQK